MATNEENEQRLAAVEKEARLARQTANKAFVLAAGAERDGADFGVRLTAQTGLIMALRETQVEQGEKIDGLNRKVDTLEIKVDDGFARMDENFAKVDENFAKVDQNFAKVDENFAKVEETFTKMAIGQAEITALLNRVIEDK